MGYDDENNPDGMSPLRKLVRKTLARYDWNRAYPALSQAVTRHHPWYLARMLLLTKLPNSTRGFISDLRNFSNKPMVQALWKSSKTSRAREAQRIVPFLQREVVKLTHFLKKPVAIERVLLTPNLLDAYWRGYGIKIKSVGYIIVGPGAEKNDGELIRHELLHVMAPIMRMPERIISPRIHKRLARLGYTTKSAISHEYIVRGLDLLYQNECFGKNITLMIKKEEGMFPRIKEAITLVKAKLMRG